MCKRYLSNKEFTVVLSADNGIAGYFIFAIESVNWFALMRREIV